MKDDASYLLSNCFFTIVLKVFWQTIAILIGSDPAQFANFFYLIDFFIVFFMVGLKIFCQIIGVPTGSDPAPFFANLFYFYERKWVNS